MNTYVNHLGGCAAMIGGCGDYRLVRQTSVWRGARLETQVKVLLNRLSLEVVSGNRAVRVTSLVLDTLITEKSA
jgi:hypothetical protein